MVCREKVRDASGQALVPPIPVAVKDIQLVPGCTSVADVQREAATLETLKEADFSVPFYGLQLPPSDQPDGHAFLIMG